MGLFAYIGVGFCVARSTEMGNAKALIAERAKDKIPHAFVVLLRLLHRGNAG